MPLDRISERSSNGRAVWPGALMDAGSSPAVPIKQ